MASGTAVGQDALTGAGYGAAAGTIIPGIGTAVGAGIGAGIGGLWGWLSDDNGPAPITNPYQGDWDALIKQLQFKASGQGPSLAQGQYNQMFSQGMGQLSAQGHSGSAADAYNATNAMGRMSMGLAQGSGQARLAEQQMYQQQLQSALSSGGASAMNVQQLQMQQQAQQQQAMSQALAAFAMMQRGNGSAGQQAPGYTQPGYIDQNPNTPIDNWQVPNG